MLSPQLIDKKLDGSNGTVSQFRNTVDDWLFGGRPVLLERYLDNRLAIHLHIGIRLLQFDAEYFCAILSRPSRPVRLKESDNVCVALGLDVEHSNGCLSHDNIEQFVFIGNIHVVQNPEDMPLEM